MGEATRRGTAHERLPSTSPRVWVGQGLEAAGIQTPETLYMLEAEGSSYDCVVVILFVTGFVAEKMKHLLALERLMCCIKG